MSKTFAAFVGTVIGILHGLVMWATLQTGVEFYDVSRTNFIPTSYMLRYPDWRELSYEVAFIVDIISLVTVLTSGWWVPRAMGIMEQLAEEVYGSPDPVNKEDGDDKE
jgi:hypothetical protein